MKRKSEIVTRTITSEKYPDLTFTVVLDGNLDPIRFSIAAERGSIPLDVNRHFGLAGLVREARALAERNRQPGPEGSASDVLSRTWNEINTYGEVSMKHPGSRGRSDRELALVAARYSWATADRPNDPLACFMERTINIDTGKPVTKAQASRLIRLARERGFLTAAPGKGLPGGKATPKAIREMSGVMSDSITDRAGGSSGSVGEEPAQQ